MLNRVHVQIVDNTLDNEKIGSGKRDSFTNQFIADSLKKELSDDYPSMVSVEYIDLSFEDAKKFSAVRYLLDSGDIDLPVILFNGIPRLHGMVVPSIIREEVEKEIESGLLH